MKTRLQFFLILNILTIYLGFSQTKNYPLGQTPAIGGKSIVWLVAEFNDMDLPANTTEKINATTTIFNDYVNQQSGGKFWLDNVSVSPVFKISRPESEIDDIEKKQRLMREAADAAGFSYEGNYIAYIMNAPGFTNFGGVGGGDGNTGTVTMGPGGWIAGIIHEMMHMFSIGHAEGIEGTDVVFPGASTGGSDPYFFMGSESDATVCPFGQELTAGCVLNAGISLPHRGRIGWINPEEYNVVYNENKTETFRIHNQDTYRQTDLKQIGLYLRGYDDEGVFVVSYIKKAASQVIQTNGVLIHYVPYRSPAVSRIIDLTPNSITTNPRDPSDAGITTWYDFGDAAISTGTAVDVSNLFNIEVVNEGLDGTDDYWADVKITPLVCGSPNPEFEREDFNYTQVATPTCSSGLSYNWNADESKLNLMSLNPTSLTYAGLNTEGTSLNLKSEEAQTFSLNRPLNQTYQDGDVFWLTYLLKPTKLENGHFFIGPNGNIAVSVGKRWGRNIAIDNTSGSNPKTIVQGETTLIVAKYVLKPGNDDVFLWTNTDPDTEPLEDDALVSFNSRNIGSINSIGVSLSGFGQGSYDIDRVYTGSSYNSIMNSSALSTLENTLGNVAMYPNPVKEVLHINMVSSVSGLVEMLDLNGRKISTYTFTNQQSLVLKTNSIAEGMYMVKIITDKGVFVKTIIKNN